MNLNWLESLAYGLVSGFAEFLPISSRAHQNLLIQMFGAPARDPVRDLFVHLAILLSLFSGCRSMIEYLRRERRHQLHIRHGHNRNVRSPLDIRLIKNAMIPMLIGFLVISYIATMDESLLTTAIFLLANGLILFLPERMMQGNKDARAMSLLDSLYIGIAGALSAFPGISRVGCIISTAIARGADKKHALNWSLLLSIPALAALIGLDILQIISHAGGIPFWGSIFTYILSAISAYLSGYIGIMLMKFLTVRVGFSGFAYYTWGLALFSFILYLTVV